MSIRYVAWLTTAHDRMGDPGIGITEVVSDGAHVIREDLVDLSDPQPKDFALDSDGEFDPDDGDTLLSSMGWTRVTAWRPAGNAYAAEVERK